MPRQELRVHNFFFAILKIVLPQATNQAAIRDVIAAT
jgi:hypothetical protein